jgi:hypothetical protein
LYGLPKNPRPPGAAEGRRDVLFSFPMGGFLDPGMLGKRLIAV